MKFLISRRFEMALIAVGIGAVVYAIYTPMREGKSESSCLSNLKQLGLATMQYVRDYDEQFMLVPNWKQSLRPYVGYSRRPPSEKIYFLSCPKTEHDYTFNRVLDGNYIELVRSSPTMPMFYETLTGINADSGQSWPVGGIHRDGSHVLFADGHVNLLPVKPTFWAPELGNKAKVAAKHAAWWRDFTASEKRRVEWIKKHQKKRLEKKE